MSLLDGSNACRARILGNDDVPRFRSGHPKPRFVDGGLCWTIRISKIVTFINMVITGVKNGSPDMILTPFDGKLDEKKDEIPPGICRPRLLQNIQY